MGKRVTMQDIADTLGITKVTVSKALNNQPGVSDSLRQEILLVAKRMAYALPAARPSSPARRLAFICPKRFFLEDDTFYTTIYYYINKRCSALGISIACFVINSTDETACLLPAQLRTECFDGLFVAGEFHQAYLACLLELPGAQVAIDFYRPSLPIDCVVTDNFYLGQQTAEYLLGKGHRDIGFVGDIQSTTSICDRYFGYRKALALHGLPARKEWHLVNNDAMTGQYTLSFELPDPLPTAFICHCDKAAFMLKQRLDRAGVAVPGQVSLISFDNTKLCELMLPHLTSVDFDRRQIAEGAIQLMFARLQSPQGPTEMVHIQGQLIERDSVADAGHDTQECHSIPCKI